MNSWSSCRVWFRVRQRVRSGRGSAPPATVGKQGPRPAARQACSVIILAVPPCEPRCYGSPCHHASKEISVQLRQFSKKIGEGFLLPEIAALDYSGP